MSTAPFLTCGTAATELAGTLADTQWSRLRFSLKNTRNKAAREPPLSVCRAILYHAWHQAGMDPAQHAFVFHPQWQSFPLRVQKGATYALEILFPTPDPAIAQAVLAALRLHLSAPSANFKLVDPSPQIEARDLASLAADVLPKLELTGDEICLDFLTPLRWNWEARDDNATWKLNWRLTRDDLRDLLQRRLQALMDPAAAPTVLAAFDAAWAEAAEAGLRLLPWFWDFQRYSHRSRTPPGKGGSTRQDWFGMEGPLYLRGRWQPLLPALLLLSAWHLGQRADQPQGRFLLRTGRTFFDRLLPDPAHFRLTDDEAREEADDADALWCGLEDRELALQRLARSVSTGDYAPLPALAFSIPKPGKPADQRRQIAELQPVDSLVQKTLSRLLQPQVDRMLEDASHAWRPGRGVETARRLVTQHLKEGYPLVLESDVEGFFDAVPWDRMEQALEKHLPRADQITRSLLRAVMRQPLQEKDRSIPRRQGLLQGSPLSPLLANLLLDRFDEAIAARGHPLVRYGDDFIILARDPAHADQALADTEAVLAELGLNIKPDKTHIRHIDTGFRFLGLDLGQEMSESFVEQSTLRKTVFVDQPYVFLATRGQALVIQKKGHILSRIPLLRIGEIIALGPVSLSSHLVAACARRQIAITFAAPSGYAVNTFHPDSQAHFEVLGTHLQRWQSAGEDDRVGIAAMVVEAKIHNHLIWLHEHPSFPATTLSQIKKLRTQLPSITTAEEARGIEGMAARLLFRQVHLLVKAEGFACAGRDPRAKQDPYNALLDFGSFLLFVRINCLLRARGLNPYLGFLHSHANHYESLVCDLQEPFRARLERFLIRLINRRIITAADFQSGTDGRFFVRGEAAGRVVEHFEKEMQTRRQGDPGTWRQLLIAQVEALRDWVLHPQTPLRLYRASGRSHRSP